MELSKCWIEDDFPICNPQDILKKVIPSGSWPTLSDDEQGVYNHLRNERYLGSMKPFSEGEPGFLGIRHCSLIFG